MKIIGVKIIFICIYFCQSLLGNAQKISNIYWYNVPSEVVIIQNKKIETKSFLTFEIDSAFFDIEIVAISSKNDIIYERQMEGDIKNCHLVKVNKDRYRFEVDVPFFDEAPVYLFVKNNRTGEKMKYKCEYINFSGKINSPQKSKRYIGIIPDGFNNLYPICKQTDSLGYYQISLPKRKYAFIMAFDNNYAAETLETWYYDMQLVENRKVKFEIGNSEIYNLHLWKNKGGGSSLFVSFRPMILDEQLDQSGIMLGTRFFKLSKQSLHLETGNIFISINGMPCQIISMQPFYETGTYSIALLSYVIQVKLDNYILNSKMNELELNFIKLLNGNLYKANAKMNFDYDRL